MGNVRFIVCAFGDRPGKAVRRPCGDRTEIVQSSCNLGILRSSCGFRAEAARRWYGDCAIVVKFWAFKSTNFTFLLVLSVEMAPKIKGGKKKASGRKMLTHRKAAAWSCGGRRGIAAR